MALTLVTPPTEWPVTLAEAKAWCRVDSSADDAVLTMLVKAACQAVANLTGLGLGSAVWRLTRDDFADTIELNRGPVLAIEEFTYTDAEGATVAVPAEVYTLDGISNPARIVRNEGEEWPQVRDRINVVQVEFTAGHTAATLPDALRLAVLGAVAGWYDERVPGRLPAGSIQLLFPYMKAGI